MRSRSSDTERSAQKQFPRHSKDHGFQGPEDMKQRQQDKDPTSESDAIVPCPKSHSGISHHGEDLSRDDLLFLLSILEGELQVSWVRIIPMFKEKASCEFGVCCHGNRLSMVHTCMYIKESTHIQNSLLPTERAINHI